MPDRRTFALQFRIGMFVVISLVVFLGVIYLLGARARYFERKYELHADFTEVSGLIEGATVRLAGVQIGRVADVELSPQVGGKVRVTLSVSRQFSERIRGDSEAQIVTQGLLGDKLIEIAQGTPATAALKPGDVIKTRDPVEVGRIFSAGAGMVTTINRLADQLQASLQKLDQSGAIEDLGATMKSARRVVEEVEKGKGWLHVLVYEEPDSIKRLNALLDEARGLLAQARTGDNAVATLLAPDSARSVRSFLTAMESLGRAVDKAKGPGDDVGPLLALLLDPQYKPMAQDLQAMAKGLREISERLAAGQGFLGGLLTDKGDGPMGEAGEDFRVAMSNLRVITERLKAGEGTVGALLGDPTVYENLAAFLEGAQRSFLLRTLIRNSIENSTNSEKK
jgi:phospholipid/cholesterol/gamma-HCH transport system substrate-binding protein